MNAEARHPVRFVLDGEIKAIDDVDPNRTVLQYLREDLHRTGTKEGCAEGDCGACTVVVADLHEGRIRYQAINSCIQFLPTLDGKALFTVESLSAPDQALHPVQQAMVDCHGSQCGFCTPGFVMSLFALYKSEPDPGRRGIDDALAGNLCRCTGYRPIIEAARRMYELGGELGKDQLNLLTACSGNIAPDEAELSDQLRKLQSGGTLMIKGAGRTYMAPSSLPDLLALAAKHTDAILLAGGTDVGLWVTKQRKDLDEIIYVGNVAELKQVERTDSHLEIGAAVSLTDAFPHILEEYPEFEELFLRFASPPIRNTGTLGGNVANGSPIGDTMPALMAAGSSIVLSCAEGRREMALEEFYIDYQKSARRPGEILECVRVPLRKEATQFGGYKISKRFDQDISGVCGVFSLRLDNGRVETIRAAFGGIAPVPKRASACEQALLGKPWDENAVQTGMTALERDFTPLTDMRATDSYRRRVAGNLLYRFYLQTTAEGRSDPCEQLYAYGRPYGR